MNYNNISAEIVSGKSGWPEIKTELSKYNVHDLNLGEKDTRAGKLFEYFTKYYFQHAPSEEGNFSNVWLFNEVPLDIRQKLNIGNTDYGVDLILENTQNQYYAVQCKFKNNERDVLNWTADKIANLFAFCPNANRFIVFTNAADLDKVSKTRHDHFTFYSITDLLELNKDFFDTLSSALTGHAESKRNLLTPRSHQFKAIENCVEFFEIEDRGQLILPCGAGKTLTALWIKERLQCRTTLVLVPSLALLRQIKNDWASQRKDKYKYICVCSEDDIDSKDEDTITSHVYEVGVNVTTEPSEIRSFLNQAEQKVIFSTYHSLPSIEAAIKGTDFKFDFIFCDEAHKTAGIGANNFSLVHDNDRVPSSKRLYATATPRIVKESLKKKLSEDLIYAYDMGDPKVFGEEFFRMTFKDAIEQDILVDYKIIAVGVNSQEVKDYIAERRYVETNISKDEIANNYALDFVMSKYSASHGITFHSRIKLGNEFAERHSKLFPNTKSFSVSGEQSTSFRNLVLNDFKKANRAIVSNSRCLTEGVDVPAIDLVYFCDPKNSKVDIVQAVGRALRKKEGKTMGLVVVPIYHILGENVEDSISASSFKNLIQVIRSLCDQDERLQDEINYLAFGKGQRKSKRIDVISSHFKEESETIVLTGFEEKLRDSLFDQIIERSSNNWDMWFLEFKEYLKEHGKYPEMDDAIGLYRWVASQRVQKKNGKLKTDEIRKLNSINFIWDKHVWKWEEMFSKLEKYAVSNEFEPHKEDEPELARWYDTQLNQIKSGTLREDRKIRIEGIKFKGAPINNKWLLQFESLVNFRKQNPNEWPKYLRKRPDSDESKLNVFCQSIKKRFNENDLDEYWFNKFVEIGFPFEGSYVNNWTTKYQSLLSYLAENKQLPSTENPLYPWFNKFRRDYLSNSLSENRMKEWEALDIDKYSNDWDTTYEAIKQWVIINKKIPTKASHNEFNSWLYSQRARFKKGTLSEDQIKKLESIGFDLLGLGKVRNESKWVEQFEKLKEFIAKENRYPGPANEKELYIWVQAQRAVKAGTARNRQPLSKEREELLNSINFVWIGDGAGGEKSWHENFEEFKKYVDDSGRLSLPSVVDGKRNELYTWWINQKNSFKKSELSEEQIQKFEQIKIDLAEYSETIKRDGFTRWANKTYEIAEFIKATGRLPRASGDVTESRLYGSLNRTKRAFQNNELTDKQLNLLKELNIDF